MTEKRDAATPSIRDLARAVLEYDSWSPSVVRMLAEAVLSERFTRDGVLEEALAACRAEYLHEETGTEGDIGYQQAVTDCVCAIKALKERAAPQEAPSAGTHSGEDLLPAESASLMELHGGASGTTVVFSQSEAESDARCVAVPLNPTHSMLDAARKVTDYAVSNIMLDNAYRAMVNVVRDGER